MTARPEQERARADARDLAEALAAYNLLLDAIVPESQYWQGEREDSDRVAYLGNIVERAAARRRAREREAREPGSRPSTEGESTMPMMCTRGPGGGPCGLCPVCTQPKPKPKPPKK